MTRTKAIILALLLLSLSACENIDSGRRRLVELRCKSTEFGQQCQARWDQSDRWSHVTPTEEIDALPSVDLSMVFECEVDPDVDVCVRTDQDRIGCFRIESDFAVAVAPVCLVDEFPYDVAKDWLNVGNGMMARTVDLQNASN